MDSTAVIAIVGLLTTLAASLVPVFINARIERKTWLRDARAAVYVDALTYVQVSYEKAEDLTLPPEYVRVRPDVHHRDLITGRMKLFSDSAAFDKWRAFLRSEEAFAMHVDDDLPGVRSRDVALPRDDPALIKHLAAADEASAALRDSLSADLR